MSKQIKVSDLKEQIGTPYPRALLKCFHCGSENSAHRGDYFMARPDHVFKCCGQNMALVTKRVVFEPA